MVTAKSSSAVAAPGAVVPRPKEESPVATSVFKDVDPTIHCSSHLSGGSAMELGVLDPSAKSTNMGSVG